MNTRAAGSVTQTDEASMLRVMEAPRKLRGVGQLESRNYGRTTAGG